MHQISLCRRFARIMAGTAVMLFMCQPSTLEAEHIVIMHTNDTHSQIDPTDANQGGVARRKVLIDSIRAAEPYTLLVDAGDAVQGTTYFNLYGGEVEAKALNALGYQYATLGNHEFDNGMEALAKYVASIDADFISTNYDLSGTPLDSLVSRYKIINIGGKKIGLIALDVNPAGIIDPERSRGVKYQDVYKAANATAWHLKHNEGVDYVVALSHIGYQYDGLPDDIDVAEHSNDIDLIIGGHSHTVVTPGAPMGIKMNTDKEPVVITQTGNSGIYLGVVTIDTDTDSIVAQLLPVDSRLDDRLDPKLLAMLQPYRHGVDSLKNIVIGKTLIDCADRKGEPLVNFVSDFTHARGNQLLHGKKVDLSIANRGGIRTGMARGNVTKGHIMEMLPFDNRVVVLEVTGRDLLDALEINTRTHRVGYDRQVNITLDDGKIKSATIDGKPIDPNATYLIATIDYIANGGDYMKPLTNGKVVAKSDNIMNLDVMNYIESLPKKTLKPDTKPRMVVVND